MARGLRSILWPDIRGQRSWVVASTCAFVGMLCAPAAAQPTRPNIIVILSDDAGYSDFGFSRSTSGGVSEFQTPHLDALAQQSVVASQGYVAAPLCGPSRAGLLTGQYSQRIGIENNLPNVITHPLGFAGDEVLLSHRLKSAGYSTGMIGKWHEGFISGVNRPNDMGFDEFFGFLSGSRQYFAEAHPANVMYRDNTVVESQWRTEGDQSLYDPLKGRYVTDAFGEESAAFIQRHAQDSNPFFLYTAFTGPHTPHTAKQQDLDHFSHIVNEQDRTLAAMVYAVDRGVGKIVDALNANGLSDNTIIVFANDNGGPALVGNNLPFRDYKGKTHEGGIRVPFLIKGPGLPPGVYDEAISTIDLAPTLVAAAGGAIPAGETDGVNLAPYLSGANASNPHDVIVWRNSSIWAVRKGDWKLARPHEPQFLLRGLYNLATDPTESVNLLAQQPQIAAELYRELTFWEAAVRKPKFGSLGDPRNLFDHFVFNAAGADTNWNAAGVWLNAANDAAATMLTDDAYANAILEFKVRQTGNYTATNNMTRVSGETFMLNEMRLTDTFTGAVSRSATINGNPLLFVKNLDGQEPRIRLAANGGAGAAGFTFNLNQQIQLLHNLQFYGNGTQTFVVSGAIQDYFEPRAITKTGTSKLTLAGYNTYRGATIVLEGELRLASAGAAIDGSSHVAVGTGGKLTFSAGLIRTAQLSIAPQGEFSFSGGTLQAGRIAGNLTNAGGVFAGGPTVGTVDILGNFMQSGGTLLLDVGTSPQGALFDKLAVTGLVQLGGVLDVDLFNSQGGGFTPVAGASYELISAAGGITGAFSQSLLPALPNSLTWQLSVGPNSVVLNVLGPPGSTIPPPFNSTGLAVWRQNFGLNGSATLGHADWSEDGNVDGADFLVWQRRLGSSAPIQSIPEPATAALGLAAIFATAAAARSGRRWR